LIKLGKKIASGAMNLGELTATNDPSGNSWLTVNSVLYEALISSAAGSRETKHYFSLIFDTICNQVDLRVFP